MAEQKQTNQTVETTEFTWHSDPGHGWLLVDADLIKELGVEEEISTFSYVQGRAVYLEEDCDASVFLDAWKAQGRGEVRFKEVFYDERCTIRDMLCYRTTLLW